jgi:hypothetical protein
LDDLSTSPVPSEVPRERKITHPSIYMTPTRAKELGFVVRLRRRCGFNLNLPKREIHTQTHTNDDPLKGDEMNECICEWIAILEVKIH